MRLVVPSVSCRRPSQFQASQTFKIETEWFLTSFGGSERKNADHSTPDHFRLRAVCVSGAAESQVESSRRRRRTSEATHRRCVLEHGHGVFRKRRILPFGKFRVE